MRKVSSPWSTWRDFPPGSRCYWTTEQFIQLRVDPYLYTIGRKMPEYRNLFEAEGKRLTENRKCLVHGDYSPKNLMVGENRMVIVNGEAVWSDAIRSVNL